MKESGSSGIMMLSELGSEGGDGIVGICFWMGRDSIVDSIRYY